MVQSVIDDIKAQFRFGNMIVRIILINGFVFLAIILIKVLSLGMDGAFFKNSYPIFRFPQRPSTWFFIPGH